MEHVIGGKSRNRDDNYIYNITELSGMLSYQSAIHDIFIWLRDKDKYYNESFKEVHVENITFAEDDHGVKARIVWRLYNGVSVDFIGKEVLLDDLFRVGGRGRLYPIIVGNDEN